MARSQGRKRPGPVPVSSSWPSRRPMVPPTRRPRGAARRVTASVGAGWLGSQAGAPRKVATTRRRPPLPAHAGRVGAVLLAVGVAATVASWWPTYLAGSGSLVDGGAGQLLLHAVPVAGWLVGALLLAAGGGGRLRLGVGAAGGSAVVVSGLDVATLGHLVASGFGPARLGFWLTVAGTLVVDLGTLAVLRRLAGAGELGAPRRIRWRWLLASAPVVAAVGVGFVPGWERYRVTAAAVHRHQSITTGSGFSNAWEVVVGEVVVLVALVVVPLLAAQWEDRGAGGAMILSVVAGLGGLVAETVVQVLTPVRGESLGFTAAQVEKYRITASLSADHWFVLELAGLAVMAVLGAALVVTGRRTAPPE